MAVSRPCSNCLKVRRCKMHLTLDRATGGTVGEYLCPACARLLDVRETPATSEASDKIKGGEKR